MWLLVATMTSLLPQDAKWIGLGILGMAARGASVADWRAARGSANCWRMVSAEIGGAAHSLRRLAGFMMRPIAATSWVHRDSSRSSCFLPAGVIR